MSLHYRRASAGDLDQVAFVDGVSFQFDYSAQDIVDAQLTVDLDRFLVAEDGDDIVGVAGDYPFTMTVPAGEIEVPGVTWVSVRPTHRRQGILRTLMHQQLSGFKDHGYLAAVLTASEAGIYGRFGYGAASQIRKTVIDTARATLRDPVSKTDVRLVKPEVARAVVGEIHDRWRVQVPGAVSRSSAWWDARFLDRESHRDGMTARRHLIHPDGYVLFRVRGDAADATPNSVCWITDYAAVTPEAHRQLWQVVLGMDLIGSVESRELPIDDPLPYLLTDPRQVRTTTLRDGLWLRPLDIAGLLSARRYGLEIDAVIEVIDPLFGTGRFRLRGGPDGADCRSTDAPADLILGVDVLGSIYLGGHRLSAVAAAGLAHAERGVLTRLDLAFLADRQPFHGTSF